MKRYSRKGRLALVPTSSSVLALPASKEVGPMVRPASVLAEAASMSNRGRLVFPSCSHPSSPRLPLLSPSPSTMTLAPTTLVVHSPLPLPVHSTLPSSQAMWTPLFLLAHVMSESHVSSPSRLASAEDMFERSSSCITMDSEDDHQHGYETPVPESQKLMIRASRHGLLVWPLCLESVARGWTQSIFKVHVLASANHRPHRTYAVDKKIAQHYAMAMN